jgi:hypothetical protein
LNERGKPPLSRKSDSVLATISRGHLMANKPEYVDLISEATRQHRRRAPGLRIVAKPEPEEISKLSRWPPAMFRKWKIETLMRWKPASWNVKDWL